MKREEKARVITQESLKENGVEIVKDDKALGQYIIYQTKVDKDGKKYRVVRPVYLCVVTKSQNGRQKGYLMAYVTINGKQFTLPLHRLVYIYFKGNFPEHYDICHLDDDSLNNDIRNLEAMPHADNIRSRKLDNGHTRKKPTQEDLERMELYETMRR